MSVKIIASACSQLLQVRRRCDWAGVMLATARALMPAHDSVIRLNTTQPGLQQLIFHSRKPARAQLSRDVQQTLSVSSKQC